MDLKENKKVQKGFTLIELLVTVVVLGILASFAFPSFFAILENRKLKGAGENLFADLIYAKTEAIKRNEVIRISATGTGTTWCYGLSQVNACDCTTANSCQIDGVDKVVSNTDYPNIQVVASSSLVGQSISFTPMRGFANGRHLQFSSSTGKELGAVVSTLGRVKLCSNQESWGYSSCPSP